MELFINIKLLDILSKLGSFLLLFGVLYLLYNFIFSIIFKLDRYIFLNKLYLSDILSVIFSIYTIIENVTLSSPYIK